MKRALVIVAAVAGYCLVESVALFSTLYPYHSEVPAYSLPVQLVVLYWAQILLIPGMGIVLGRFTYGAYRWRTRALMSFLIWFVSIPGILIAFLLVVLLLEWIFMISKFQLLFFLALAVTIGGFALALFLIIRAVRKRTIEINAASWLAERERGMQLRERKRRNFGVLVASWIPVATVFFVFLFLFEIWGVILHLSNPHLGDLPGYRVPVPITWTADSSEFEREKGAVWLSGYVFDDIGSNVKRYSHADVPVSHWSVSTEPYDKAGQTIPLYRLPQANEDVVGRRSIGIGEEVLTCEEYWPAYLARHQSFKDSGQILVYCGGSSRLSASFGGEKGDLPRFYKMLEGTTLVK